MKRLILLGLVIFSFNKILPQNYLLTYKNNGSIQTTRLSEIDSVIIFTCGIDNVNYGGKIYHTVYINNQCWLKENLDVGTRIDGSSSQTNNGTIEKYCYNNDPINCNIYGGLYQWNEAMQYSTIEGTRGICPLSWHIPTRSELLAAGGDGNALKDVGQGSGNNSSGFSALLAGSRNTDGSFSNLTWWAYFWSSKEFDSNNSIYLGLDKLTPMAGEGLFNKQGGISVRCIKD